MHNWKMFSLYKNKRRAFLCLNELTKHVYDMDYEIIQKFISSMEITRDENYKIEIKNIKFTEGFIARNSK